ncbi:MAG TPA: GNAT family N-acetyltransferase [Anaerolineae bacterium]|nr:GNAT family N-acetyltransferase [Anaerolineae bacterium]
MGDESGSKLALEFHPLTSERWRDLETLFGPRGAVGGCWCLWWRLKRSEFSQKAGAGNRRMFKQIVKSGAAPGILAYAGGQPIGWVAVAPREAYPVLDRSPTLKRVDDQPVWSVTCFFVARSYRRQGVTVALLKAAVEYARRRGAQIVEGYPIEPKRESVPDPWVFTGLAAAFRKAGFVEVLRRSETRPIMRYFFEPQSPKGAGERKGRKANHPTN